MTQVSAFTLLAEIQYHLLEPVNYGLSYYSEEWTQTEVVDYLRNRQNQFLKDTALLLKRATITFTPGQARQPLPSDWVITQRMDWKTTATGAVKELPRSDGWDVDYGDPSWINATNTTPAVYMDEELPSLVLQIAPVPTEIGSLEILYVYSVVLPTYPTDTLDWPITVPADFTPALKYGVLADMFSKVGRAQDLVRAAYCESRYQEGVEAARVILAGWQGG